MYQYEMLAYVHTADVLSLDKTAEKSVDFKKEKKKQVTLTITPNLAEKARRDQL